MLPVYKERKSKSGFWLCFSVVVLLIVSVFSLTVTPSADEGLEWEVQEKGFWEFHSHDQRFWHKDADKYCRQLTKRRTLRLASANVRGTQGIVAIVSATPS